MLFLFYSQSLVKNKNKKNETFLIHFGKRIDENWWLWLGLGRCDTVDRQW